VTPLELRMSTRCLFLGFASPSTSFAVPFCLGFAIDLYTAAILCCAGLFNDSLEKSHHMLEAPKKSRRTVQAFARRAPIGSADSGRRDCRLTREVWKEQASAEKEQRNSISRRRHFDEMNPREECNI
jgi:hypothetical protein